MEYCASAASMLAEEIWQNAEGFVEEWLETFHKTGSNIINVMFHNVQCKLNKRFHTQCGKWKVCNQNFLC